MVLRRRGSLIVVQYYVVPVHTCALESMCRPQTCPSPPAPGRNFRSRLLGVKRTCTSRPATKYSSGPTETTMHSQRRHRIPPVA